MHFDGFDFSAMCRQKSFQSAQHTRSREARPGESSVRSCAIVHAIALTTTGRTDLTQNSILFEISSESPTDGASSANPRADFPASGPRRGLLHCSDFIPWLHFPTWHDFDPSSGDPRKIYSHAPTHLTDVTRPTTTTTCLGIATERLVLQGDLVRAWCSRSFDTPSHPIRSHRLLDSLGSGPIRNRILRKRDCERDPSIFSSNIDRPTFIIHHPLIGAFVGVSSLCWEEMVHGTR